MIFRSRARLETASSDGHSRSADRTTIAITERICGEARKFDPPGRTIQAPVTREAHPPPRVPRARRYGPMPVVALPPGVRRATPGHSPPLPGVLHDASAPAF